MSRTISSAVMPATSRVSILRPSRSTVTRSPISSTSRSRWEM